MEGDQDEQQHGDEPQQEQEERPERRQRRDAQAAGPPQELHNLLRILARQRVVLAERARAATNADLIAALRESGMLTSEAVAGAMLAVPRGAFVPIEHRAEAYVDAPIRVEAEGFNISAPHMHASMLESLRLQPGDRFLDVGCGCGVLAACAAMLVGPSGRVAGVDTRDYCVELSADNVDRLRTTSPDYAAASCDVEFEKHNIFLPSRRYRGRYNKVCVGAACPEERVHLLLQLLPQEQGSLLLAPVDTDLRLYERRRDGSARSTTISSVRFSELEVPSDATVALAMLDDAAAERLAVQVSPSTWARDMGPLTAGGTARCPHFRARLSSGMRDSDGPSHAVPEAFAQHSVQALVSYIYTDVLPSGLEPPQLAELLHVGSFYGCTRLIELCEHRLVDALLQLEPEQGAAEAPSLLRLGGELGLTQLQRAAAAFIAAHYSASSKSEAYAALSRAEVDRVAAELAAGATRVRAVLAELQPSEGFQAQTAAERQRILWF
ncbi:Protein-L-isoaspartate O-methyltransferase [Monoraphidium neglectum]|uniref:protein-L-isoaspartate(D-aspartate) O-methyltransferase n=1 Tax=Monoraphidium neglectum TaxID=145388 RepID=A0A0D2MSC9_9CHLO|nr:Protein-L-isoaspartate O-methyltransferase [Monoraphidium neglectum]KIZ03317.1 Protein-L-isoaspartate O-methyltransferase [Monoraphidium neglectum]|eukprot:XP_013902336.1 Protein-L-isoaspartate O-methyltransferase [Monoraphidium neglectum]